MKGERNSRKEEIWERFNESLGANLSEDAAL